MSEYTIENTHAKAAITSAYNKAYYQKHRVTTLARLTARVQCDHCSRTVSFQRLPLHKQTMTCRMVQLHTQLKGKTGEARAEVLESFLTLGVQ